MAMFPEGRRSLSAYAYALGPARRYLPAYRFIAADVGVERGAWLDIGCGPGELCILGSQGRPELDVIGIDTSETMLSIAEGNKGPRLNVTFRKMDGAKIIYPEGTFDVVTAVQSAHHWDDASSVFSEAYRVLVPGGRFYVYEADPDAEIPDGWIEKRAGWPPDAVVRRSWRKWGMDQSRWDGLRSVAEASPFGSADAGGISDERHGFYRRLVCTR
jgi:ubiquinone/menaquinone biosynthesis C-methylase UbiE